MLIVDVVILVLNNGMLQSVVLLLHVLEKLLLEVEGILVSLLVVVLNSRFLSTLPGIQLGSHTLDGLVQLLLKLENGGLFLVVLLDVSLLDLLDALVNLTLVLLDLYLVVLQNSLGEVLVDVIVFVEDRGKEAWLEVFKGLPNLEGVIVDNQQLFDHLDACHFIKTNNVVVDDLVLEDLAVLLLIQLVQILKFSVTLVYDLLEFIIKNLLDILIKVETLSAVK